MRCEECYHLGRMCDNCIRLAKEEALANRKVLHCSAVYSSKNCPPGPNCKGCRHWIEGLVGSASVNAAAHVGLVYDPQGFLRDTSK